MADVKISQLPSASTPLAGTEEIPLVQSSTTKKITVSNLLTSANLGTPTAVNLANATNVPMTQASGVLPVANGGTGTTTPSLVAGSNVTVSGTWPNQTIAATGGGGGSGTVTSMSVVSANGLAGTVANATTTPAVTLSTSVTGIVKGNGTALSAATAGTDYVAPGGALGTPSSGTATNLTGLPLSTGVTGTLPVANGGTGTTSPALVAGTNVTITGTWPNQTINATGGGGGSGTVTSASVVSANGFAGTVANATTTPAITLSTSITGVLKGNGTALSAATAGTDYVAPGGALGTPSSGTATNLTGLPLSTGVTGTLPIANGGSGQTTAQTAMNAFAGAVTSGSYLRGNGTNVVMSTIQAADVPTLNQNTTGTAANVTGIVAIANGGTGQTSFTSNYIHYGSFSTSANLQFDGTVLRVGSNALLGGTTNPVAGFTGGTNNYIQSYIYNATNGASSSADFVAYASNSTDAHGWADMGFTSPSYADATYTVTGPNEAYLFGSALNSTYTGNLVYATDSTGSANSHQWYVGGFTQAKSAWKMQLTSTGLQLANALGVAYGGTGLTSTPANGALDIGNGTGFTRTTLTAGSGISITNGSGSITIAASSSGVSQAKATMISMIFGF